MVKFRIDSMAALARQMTFTPQDTLQSQLSAAERLLNDIDPAKAYPLDFVIFRITGYHPRRVEGSLLTGLALQHDLGLLIERLSETLQQRTEDLPEPVLAIDDVTEKFNVTSKTIQRWRRRGLPARRFIFPDGKRRVGFLLSSVERFLASHREQALQGANLAPVSDDERARILRRAGMLARDCHCSQDEIARRIARKLNRSPLTILHTIRRHDQEHPDQAILTHAAAPFGDEQRSRILRAHRHGSSIAQLASRHCSPRAAIYRALVDERLARLSRRKTRFIDDPLYHQPDAETAINAIAAGVELDRPDSAEQLRIPRDLPPYLQDLYRTPLLTPARERALFLKFNFHKHQFMQARRRLEPQFARWRDLDELERPLRLAAQTKNAIVAANLRLVVSVARKHLRPGLNLMELISDGNITLLRAVEGFDIHKGHRFSTYATFALMKGFARSVPLMQAAARRAGSGSPGRQEMLGQLADPRHDHFADRLSQRDEVGHLLSRLEERERIILQSRYGLDDAAAPASYEEVGLRMGLSKQRVRQIEQSAIAKLRQALARPRG